MLIKNPLGDRINRFEVGGEKQKMEKLKVKIGYATPEPIEKGYSVTGNKKDVLRFLTSKKTVKAVAPIKKTVKREKPIIIKAKPKLTPKPLLCMKLIYSKPVALNDNLYNPRIPKANRKDSLMELIEPLKLRIKPIFVKFGEIKDVYTYIHDSKVKTRRITSKATYKVRKINGKMVKVEYPKNQLKPEHNPNTPIEKGSLRELSQFITLKAN